ncbi:peptide deformylase [Saccharothrix obliqua]|uniref:peptide deformylase n=1 Tax=Saccharothrix obliqua TaxID=2861747 RepID=UPI001C5DE081|nr:peptide deformylase [Saccharothrix obliqua]MBW4717097.1 peptide deformylase [Saccharothrix obliqua]
MNRLPIVLFGQPVLHTPTRPVERVDDGLRRLVEAMFETMDAAPGAGLAANQVGVDLRVFVYDCGPGARGCVVNPVLERLPGGLQDGEEGCLSAPGLAYPTPRAMHVRCTGLDLAGEELSITAEGYLARCFQHEVDHLDGKVYLERLGGRALRRARADVAASPWHGREAWHA